MLLNPLRRLKRQMSRRDFELELSGLLPQLYRTARGLTGRNDDAEELAHDVCIKAIEAFDNANLKDSDACRAWLHRIMLNTFRDRYRRDRNSPIDPHFNLDNVVDLVPSRTSGPAGEYQRQLFHQRLDAALQSLGADVRYATVLHLIKGFAYKDIATVMDCPVGTVMSRIAKGRKVLRGRLEELDLQDPSVAPACGEGVDK